MGVTGAAVLGVVMLAAWHGSACAEPLETAYMTWPEIRDAVATGKTTILIPSGGTEQNGPHMITGKHNLIVAETARRVAQSLGDALVAPVIAYTPEGDIATRNGHMAYPGSISISPEIFAGILDGAARSFQAHGFKTVVFIGDSGPNQGPQQAVAAALQREWAAQNIRVLSANTYYQPEASLALLKAEGGETEASIGTHAGIRDTSELLAIAPGGVHLDRAVADSDGVSGDPRRATAERGWKLIDAKVAAAVAEIRAAQRAPTDVAHSADLANTPSLLARVWRWIFG